MKRFMVMGALLSLVLSPSAQALILPDQSYVDGTGYSYTILPKAQTFTVGIDGTLNRVSLGLFNTDSAQMYILPVSSGLPPVDFSAALYSSSIPDSFDSVNERWIDFDLSAANLAVNPGDQFAIGIQGNSALGWGSLTTNGSSYAGGQALEQRFDINTFDFYWSADSPFGGERDYHFKTFVEAKESNNVVPEPMSLLLLGVALPFVARYKTKKSARV